MQAGWRINKMRKKATSANKGACEMQIGLFDEGEGREHNGVGLLETFYILTTQNDFFGWDGTGWQSMALEVMLL